MAQGTRDISPLKKLFSRFISVLWPGRQEACHPILGDLRKDDLHGSPSLDLCSACLSAVAHQLSQPLTVLRGSLELALLSEGTAAQYRAALEQSLEQADQLVRLLGSLRELADCGEKSQACERVLFGELVNEAVEAMRPFAESRALRLSLESGNDLYVRGNSCRLRQAIFKVVYNAVQGSSEGGTVRISLRAFEKNTLLTVSHHVQANPADTLNQLSMATSLGHLFSEACKGGTLEWAIAKRILETQGGAVQVESTTDGECSFSVRLPLDPSETGNLKSSENPS